MKFRSAYLASTAATLLASAAIFTSSATAQETDWTKRVTLSAKGGHIMGNPLAKHRVAEYMSYTCNHCANFEKQSHSSLKSSFIAKGDISFEIRNLVLNRVDLTAAILARCGGRTKFFGNHRAFLTQQANWMSTYQSSSPETLQSITTGTMTERFKKISKAAGFYGLMKKRGYSKKKVNACLANPSTRKTILDMTQYATKTLKLTGTPGFSLNGKVMTKVYNWTTLQKKLIGLPK